ncbi:hypothetical protein [Kordiimonas sp.]|uniref:hypothetical protein n=1 Tax=Kordiimonas sp. TaxID=1970157 RepID=UPI003A8ED99B
MARPRKELETGHFARDARDRRKAISVPPLEDFNGFTFEQHPRLRETIERIWVQYIVRSGCLVVAKPFKDVHQPFFDLDRSLRELSAQIKLTVALRPKAQGDLEIRAALHPVLSDAGKSMSTYDEKVEVALEAINVASIAVRDLDSEVKGILNALNGAESTFRRPEQLRDEARLDIRNALQTARISTGHGVNDPWNKILMHLEGRVRDDDANADMNARENLRDELSRLLKKPSRGSMPEDET